MAPLSPEILLHWPPGPPLADVYAACDPFALCCADTAYSAVGCCGNNLFDHVFFFFLVSLFHENSLICDI